MKDTNTCLLCFVVHNIFLLEYTKAIVHLYEEDQTITLQGTAEGLLVNWMLWRGNTPLRSLTSPGSIPKFLNLNLATMLSFPHRWPGGTWKNDEHALLQSYVHHLHVPLIPCLGGVQLLKIKQQKRVAPLLLKPWLQTERCPF